MSEPIVNEPVGEQTSDERRMESAGDWLLRLETSDLEQHELAAWLEWHGSDPRNREAFEQMQAAYESMRGLGDSQREALATRIESLKSAARAPTRRPVPWLLAAASVAAVVGLGWTFSRNEIAPHADSHAHTAVYHTDRAAHRTVKLPDGSEVRLGGASSVSLNYTDEARYLVLEGGEGYFEVARDFKRPFIVQAGSVRVRAIGTAFNVRRADQRVVVTVSDGAVDVARENESAAKESAPNTVRVTAGKQATLSSDRAPLSLASVDTDAVLGWQSGRLEFVNEPLRAVIATVNRYSRHKLVVADASLDTLTYTGTVEKERIEEWLRALEDVFPLHARAAGGEAILLQKN